MSAFLTFLPILTVVLGFGIAALIARLLILRRAKKGVYRNGPPPQ